MFSAYLKTRNHLYTGRASTAIYLALCANRVCGAHVLVPANICYAAVLPILYAGNRPIFADVGEDGNLTCATIEAVWDNNIKAAIIPHMYGNPCREMAEICKQLHVHGTLVIEDCASAMGAEVSGVMTGTFGDYAIYSFGHSKTIDCGYGGLIVSQRNLDALAALNAKICYHTQHIDDELQLFSQLYRVLRNNITGVLTEAIYKCALQQLQHCFLFRAPPEQIFQITSNIGTLEEIIRQRRKNTALYAKYFKWTKRLREYTFHAGAVPWRYNVLVDATRKQALIAELLRRQIAVSDWYPVITPMFGVNKVFPYAQKMENELINLPLINVTESEILYITQIINQFFIAN